MWEEGAYIYDTPGVPNNFPFEKHTHPQDSKKRENAILTSNTKIHYKL